MNKRLLKNLDWGILICVILLLIIGLISLYSASESGNFEEFKKQCIWIGISLPILFISTIVEYSVLAKFSKILYCVLIILLVVVLFMGSVNRGKKLV